MNVFYPTTKTGPVMAPTPEEERPTYSHPVWLTEGCVYWVEDGALLYTPRYGDGSYDNMEWVEVDFESLDEEQVEKTSAIHYQLVYIKEQGLVNFQ